MKGLLFLVGGGLLGYWWAMKQGKDKCADAKDVSATATPGAAIVDVVATEQTPPAAIMPSEMLQKYDASPNATTSPALTTITPIGASSLDSFDHEFAAYFVR